jgi:hypothetical protein
MVKKEYINKPKEALNYIFKHQDLIKDEKEWEDLWRLLSYIEHEDMPENYHAEFREELEKRIRIYKAKEKAMMFKFDKTNMLIDTNILLDSAVFHEAWEAIGSIGLDVEDNILKNYIRESEKETKDLQEIILKVMTMYHANR